MPPVTRRKSKQDPHAFVPMERTRAMLDDVWKHLREMVGQSPDAAKRMMNAAIRDMHKTEKAVLRKAKSEKKSLDKTAKKTIRKAARKAAKAPGARRRKAK